MTIIGNEMLWRQFGPAIDMLGDALSFHADAVLRFDDLRSLKSIPPNRQDAKH